MDAFSIAGVIFLGLTLGSFATALSYRLPRDISLLSRARSQCSSCERALTPTDLVPLFSWIFLKGKCRHCRAPIGWRYPLIELATLALCLLFYSIYGFGPETVLIFALAPVIVSIIDIDLNFKIIPDILNLSVLLIGGGLLFANAFFDANPANFVLNKGATALGGAALYGLGSLLLRQAVMWMVGRESMGLGDIKFFAAAGFWLGTNAEAAALFMIVSGLSGVLLSLVWKKFFKETETPFGPSLMIAFIAVLCVYPPAFILVK